MSRLVRNIIKRICLVALIIIAGAFVLSVFVEPFTLAVILLFSLGVFITSALNCFKIFMIERTAMKISNMNSADIGKGYAFIQYVLRYFLTAIVVGIVFLIMYLVTGESPFISLEAGRSALYGPIVVGLIVGLFTMKIAVITAGKIEDYDIENDAENETDGND